MHSNTVKIIGAVILVLAIVAGAYVVKQNKIKEASIETNPLTYSMVMPKTSYKQSENIPMIMIITNNSNATTTLSFTSGCQVSYKIGTFDLANNIRCLPEPSKVEVPGSSSVQLGVTHYASVRQLPVGTSTLVVNVIGYGEVKTEIKITK